MVSRRQGYGDAKCAVVAGKLGSRRIAGTTGAPGALDSAGSDSHISSGNIYRRRPRGSPSLWASGDGSIRYGGGCSLVLSTPFRVTHKQRNKSSGAAVSPTPQ